MSQNLWIKMGNLVFELEKKLGTPGAQPVGASGNAGSVSSPAVARNLERMKAVLEEAGLLVLNPNGETYSETRTDLEASITGSSARPMIVLDVIKPIIYSSQDGTRSLVQKGVVIVGNK